MKLFLVFLSFLQENAVGAEKSCAAACPKATQKQKDDFLQHYKALENRNKLSVEVVINK